MRINLFWRILISLLFIIGTITCLVKFWLEPVLIEHYAQQDLQNATSIVNVFSSMLAQEFRDSCTFKRINELSQELSIKTRSQVVIDIPNCETSELGNFDLSLYRNQPDLFNVLSGQSVSKVKSLNNNQTVTLYSAMPIFLDNTLVGAVQVEESIASLPIEILIVINRIYFTLLLLTLFSIGFSFLLHRYYSGKLKNASNSLLELSEIKVGYKTKISLLSTNEIEQLEKTIKQSVAEIHKKMESYSSDARVFTSILDSMNDGILVADQNGQVNLINNAAANLFSIEINQAEKHSMVEVLRNHVIEGLWQNCMETQKIHTIDTEISPQHRYIRCIATPLSPQLPGSVLLLFQDLTRIHQLEIIRQDFVSNVSHELRTPLASLKALVETLQESAAQDPEASKRFLEKMDTEIDNLTQIVQELLELSKIESGRVPLEKREITPNELLSKVGERMQLQVQKGKLDLFIRLQQKLPVIIVDINRMEQVLVNLVHNAIKFTLPGGKITLSAFQQNHEIIFSVEDTGIGIPPRDLERIFERFFKVDRARSEHGTGLGLSIARHLVEAHGGRIWAESIHTKGSTFFFSIPINSG
jgi:two-component system, OmpR family, phosphate regulon sensor histidine kinase PhoR